MNFSKQIGDDDSKRQEKKHHHTTERSFFKKKMIANTKHLIKNYGNVGEKKNLKEDLNERRASTYLYVLYFVHLYIENVFQCARGTKPYKAKWMQ